MGLPAALVADIEASDRDGARYFEVWPINMPVVDAFLTIASQWRASALGDGRMLWHGLDYSGVGQGLDRAGITLTPAQWLGLGVMERAAAHTLNGGSGNGGTG